MSKKKRPNVWEIENYFWSNQEEKNKIQEILNKYYDSYWKDILSRKISRQEFNDVTKNIWQLCNQSLEDIHFLVEHNKSYGSDDRLLKSIFKNKQFQVNVDKDIVALKAALIDFTNSTNLNKQRNSMTLEQLAINITKLDFDNRLKEDGVNLTKDIAMLYKKDARLWSFASKYVLYHDFFVNNCDNYVIFDNVLKANLWRYYPTKIGKTYIENLFGQKETTNNPYSIYLNLINEILDKHDINIPFKRRKFDHFIWWQFKGLVIKGEKKSNKLNKKEL